MKGLRLLVLVILIILALCGVPVIILNNKERYIDNEIKTEQVDKDEDEEDEDQSKQS